MPHIVLEHNLEDERLVNKVCKKLHNTLSKQETVKLESIKTRSVEVRDLIFSDNLVKVEFAHVCLKLLPGRSDELKSEMSKALLGVLKSEISQGTCSVEVKELENYSKN